MQGRRAPLASQDSADPLVAEGGARAVDPLEEPVGEEQQRVAGLEPQRTSGRLEPVAEAERERAERRLLDRAVPAADERRRMSGADEGELAGRGIELVDQAGATKWRRK